MKDNANFYPLSAPSEQSGVLQPPRTGNLYQEYSQQGYIQQQPTTAVVVTQPGYAGQAARRPPNYLSCAFLITLFCCLWTGLTAIKHARQANNLAAQGDMQGAIKHAKSARNWIIFSIVCGVVEIIAVIVVIVVYFPEFFT